MKTKNEVVEAAQGAESTEAKRPKLTRVQMVNAFEFDIKTALTLMQFILSNPGLRDACVDQMMKIQENAKAKLEE